MRNHRDDIKNEVAYFNKVVQNMNNTDLRRNVKINELEQLSNEIEEICYKSDEYFRACSHKEMKSSKISDIIVK